MKAQLNYLLIGFIISGFISCKKFDKEEEHITISVIVKDVYSQQPIPGIRVNLYYCKSNLFGSGSCDSVNAITTGNGGQSVFFNELSNRYNENPPTFTSYQVAAIKTGKYTGSETVRLNANNEAEIVLYPFIKKALYIISAAAYDKAQIILYNDQDYFTLSEKAELYNIKCVPGIKNTLSISLFKNAVTTRDTSITFTPALGDTSAITVNL